MSDTESRTAEDNSIVTLLELNKTPISVRQGKGIISSVIVITKTANECCRVREVVGSVLGSCAAAGNPAQRPRRGCARAAHPLCHIICSGKHVDFHLPNAP